MWKTVPHPDPATPGFPPPPRRSFHRNRRRLEQRRERHRAFVGGEGVEGREIAGEREAKDDAAVVAHVVARAVERRCRRAAVAGLGSRAPEKPAAGVAIEVVDRRDGAGRVHAEHGAVAECAAAVRRPVVVAVARQDQPGRAGGSRPSTESNAWSVVRVRSTSRSETRCRSRRSTGRTCRRRVGRPVEVGSDLQERAEGHRSVGPREGVDDLVGLRERMDPERPDDAPKRGTRRRDVRMGPPV